MPGKLEELRQQLAAEAASPMIDASGANIADDVRDVLMDSGYDRTAADYHAQILQAHYLRLAEAQNAINAKHGAPATTAGELYRKANITVQTAMPQLLEKPELRQQLDPILDQLRHIDAKVDPANIPANMREYLNGLAAMGIDLSKHPTNESVYQAVHEHLTKHAAATRNARVAQASIHRHGGDAAESRQEMHDAEAVTKELGPERLGALLAEAKARAEKTPVVEAQNVPYGMGMDRAGKVAYKDPDFLREHITDSGKAIDTVETTKIHEIAEHIQMDQGVPYERAHAIANAVEAAFLREKGHSEEEVRKYENEIHPMVRRTRKWTGEPPDDLDTRPYEQEGETELLVPPNERTEHSYDQSGTRIVAPTSGDLQHPAILRQWRKAFGDRQPDTSSAEWRKLVEDSAAKDALLGKYYEQPTAPGGVGRRGSITFGSTGVRISLSESRNLSTLLHEYGHLFLENFANLAESPDASPQLKADWQAAMDWLGVKNRSEIQTEHHEKWAEGFEEYLKEGKAPSPALHRVFAAISAWMTNVYRHLKGQRVELSPEIRSVFDRLLASEDETKAANDHLAADPLFTTAAQAGMTDTQFESYQKRALDDRIARQEDLTRRFMAVHTREAQKLYDAAAEITRAEVMAELNEDPAQSAVAALQNQKRPDGTPLPPGFTLKLSRAEIAAVYGKENLKRLPGPGSERNRGRPVYAIKGGISLDDAAQLLHFKSGDELFHALINAPDLKRTADAMVADRMRQTHPDPLTSGRAELLAIDAAHNAKRAALMDDEATTLAKKLGTTSTPRQLMRITAQDTISKLAPKDIRPQQYQLAEAKHGRDAFAHAAAGRFDKALIAQQKRQLNFELYRAATDAQAEASKIRQEVARYGTSAMREKIGKAGGWEWTVTRQENGQTFAKKVGSEEEAKAVAAQHPGATYERTSSYLQDIDRQLTPYNFRVGKGGKQYEHLTPEQFLADPLQQRQEVAPDTTYWRDLPMDHLRAVRDGVVDVAQRALNMTKMLALTNRVTFEQTRDGLHAGVLEHSKGPREVRLGDDLMRQIRDPIVAFFDNQATAAALTRRMDGHKDGGKTWELLQKPLNVAQDEKAKLMDAAGSTWNKLLNDHGKLGFGDIKAPLLLLKEHVPELGQGVSRWTRIMVALNWGNAGNRERLLQGHHWTEEQANAVMRGLDAKDLALVRGIWKWIASYKSAAFALEERVHGVAPKAVEATPFEINGEKMEGGYFPIVYDNRLSAPPMHETAEARAEAMLNGTGGGYAMTAHGHLKERQGSQGRPLNLSIDVVGKHVASVIHDLTHREMLIDQNRLLHDKQVKDSIESHWGVGTWRQFDAQLKYVAMGGERDVTGMGKFSELFRQGGNMAQRSFNVLAAAQQIFGIPNALPRLGVANFFKAIPAAFTPSMHHQAEEMSHALGRRNSLHDENLANQVSRTSALGFLNPVRHVGMMAINTAWKVLDAHAWWGGFYKAMDQTGGDREKSARIADQIMVDTQGGFEPKDVPQALQGGWAAKLFTNQMSWANANYNLMASSILRFADSRTKGAAALGLAADMLTYLVISPALYLAGRQLLSGQDMSGWTDPGKAAAMLGGEGGYTVLSSMPLLREASALVKNGERYEGPQGLSGFDNLMRLVGDIRNAHSGESDKQMQNLRKAAVLGVATPFHLPGAAINHALDGWLWAEEHGLNPILPTLMGPPPKQ
jgi:hypothetical protein